MTNRLPVAILAIVAAICAAQTGAFAGASPATQPGELRGKGIAFVCDASDTMIPKIDVVRRELANTLDGMRPIDKFGVIFMRAKGCAQLDTRLLPATPANKEKGKTFVAAFKPGGSTDPIPAVEAAFKAKPDCIYLLADHDFPDGPALVARIGALNRDRSVKVNTIALLGQDDHDTDFMKALQRIAEESKGTYRFVKASDL